MLFISIYTYQPAKRDEVLARRTKSLFTPEGAKCLGQWSDAGGGRVVTLFECSDSMVGLQWCHAWNDLGKFEIFPVVDTEELLKAMANK